MRPLRFHESRVLDDLVKDRRTIWRELDERTEHGHTSLSLGHLSFFDDPEHVLNLFDQLVREDCSAQSCELHFDMDSVEDLAPFLFFAEIWEELSDVVKIGRVSRDVRKVLAHSSLTKPLGCK